MNRKVTAARITSGDDQTYHDQGLLLLLEHTFASLPLSVSVHLPFYSFHAMHLR